MPSSLKPEEKGKLWLIIGASSVGTLIEWYDFFIFGSLSTILATQFFPSENPTLGFLSVLATFAVGFVVRPFGALFFGRLGDLVGRKYTFLVTLLIMGTATVGIGLVPNYNHIGVFAPAIVILLRLTQGLALGGQYGGAATYVAEHAPVGQRGFYTSFIQTTATFGLLVSLGVIVAVRKSVGVEAFADWGWRIPFLLSAILVVFSIFLRMRMAESPLFAKAKAEGTVSKNPIKESFGNKKNLRLVLIALFGATAGQGVVWYTGQFYVLTFMQKTCNLEFDQSNYLLAIALVIATPLFVFFGWLSDRIGRKRIMMAGMLLGVLLYFPIYKKLFSVTDITLKNEIAEAKSISRTTNITPAGDTVKTSKVEKRFADQTVLAETTKEIHNHDQSIRPSRPEVKKEVTLNGMNYWIIVGLIFIQVFLVTMVYGPIAAFLVELFPIQIRYTSMSLPYHIGNGVFGGMTPFLATWFASLTVSDAHPAGNPFAGLWYPVIVAGICFVVGMIFLKNKNEVEV